MTKNRTYQDYLREGKKDLLIEGYEYMMWELDSVNAPSWMRDLLDKLWEDFKKGKFSYDGASFSNERNSKKTKFEFAAFTHDGHNGQGFVGYKVDELMLLSMHILNYPEKMIVGRWIKTRFTFLNIWRHKYWLKDYKGDILFVKNDKITRKKRRK